MDKTLKKLLRQRVAAERQFPSDSAFRRYFRANAEIWKHLVGSRQLPIWELGGSTLRNLNHDNHVIRLTRLSPDYISYPSYRGQIDPPIPSVKEVIVHRSAMESYFPVWAIDIDWIFKEED